MRAVSNSNNKNDLKPHTNTLKTNTSRIKSWRHTLLRKRTPAVMLITIGFFIVAFLPAYAVVLDTSNETSNEDTPSDHKDTNPSTDQPSRDSTGEVSSTESISGSVTSQDQSSSSSTTSVEVRSSKSSSSSSGTESSAGPTTNLTVNGQRVDLPESGRYRETIKTEDSTTRIKANLDSGNSNISISIDNDSETEVE